ncbi:DUF4625 domain-containing protein [Carboxylicivirga sp. A043]|uniref:DUF4625 domain-containing protein n=1 Tax=Carboxylicivirga litoralis TaxID=2816963 RepID=UPI0021CAFD3C|nr:DUF4625 domain-containing protein [Carboxylicivirga sp. A043]MCU4158334.1 DUF4625 domain-containing protein [Carboxylicivirga sp. A043]
MKTRFLLMALAIISTLFVTSCDNDDNTAKPVVTITELGYENSKIGYAGTDLHIEAEIVAEAGIKMVEIEVHPEGEHTKGATDEHEDEWEETYTYEYDGEKNTTFHEHIDIPVYAEAGDYHFHFVVTDMEGNQKAVEEELEVQLPIDANAPTVSVSSAPTANQQFNNGETITISGAVSDELALGGIYIGLVRDNQNLTDADVNATNTITLLHTHDFTSATAHDFTASIVVGAAEDNNITPKDITGDIAWQSANYYIIVKCKDAFGGNWTISQHYPIVINL